MADHNAEQRRGSNHKRFRAVWRYELRPGQRYCRKVSAPRSTHHGATLHRTRSVIRSGAAKLSARREKGYDDKRRVGRRILSEKSFVSNACGTERKAPLNYSSFHHRKFYVLFYRNDANL